MAFSNQQRAASEISSNVKSWRNINWNCEDKLCARGLGLNDDRRIHLIGECGDDAHANIGLLGPGPCLAEFLSSSGRLDTTGRALSSAVGGVATSRGIEHMT